MTADRPTIEALAMQKQWNKNVEEKLNAIADDAKEIKEHIASLEKSRSGLLGWVGGLGLGGGAVSSAILNYLKGG